MKVYRTDEIRNVVLLGHGGSGKTSLAEAMAYVSGATNRMGSVENGNTISDFDKEEQKRKFSLSTSLIPIEWEKAKINICLLYTSISWGIDCAGNQMKSRESNEKQRKEEEMYRRWKSS